MGLGAWTACWCSCLRAMPARQGLGLGFGFAAAGLAWRCGLLMGLGVGEVCALLPSPPKEISCFGVRCCSG